jgi:hypothetical protein
MTSNLPKKSRIKNFSDDPVARNLFLTEVRELNALFRNPLIHSLGVVPVTATNNIIVGASTLEQHIQSSLQRLYEYHVWTEQLIGASIARGEDVPTMSVFLEMGRNRKNLDYHTIDLMERMDEGRPYDADDLAKETFKVVLLEVGKLHLLMQQEGALSAMHEIRQRCARQSGSMLNDKRLLGIFKKAPVDQEDFLDAQKKISDIFVNLQKAMCVALPDSAIQELIEHPLSAPLSVSDLDKMRQDFFCLYTADAKAVQQSSFADRFMNTKNVTPKGIA